MAQSLRLFYYYEYDAAGNRTVRKVVHMKPPDQMPPAPSDSTLTEDIEGKRRGLPQQAGLPQQTAGYFVETIAQTEIKIYPNPTTEKITLDIAGWETLQTGIFKLYSLTGQLLQERPVHSAITEISLAGLASGTYILKVQINDRIEEWKVIKN
jgi:hypothetical protein